MLLDWKLYYYCVYYYNYYCSYYCCYYYCTAKLVTITTSTAFTTPAVTRDTCVLYQSTEQVFSSWRRFHLVTFKAHLSSRLKLLITDQLLKHDALLQIKLDNS